MGRITNLPPACYDITDYITDNAGRSGSSDVTAAILNRVEYCRDNDLTLMLPNDCRFKAVNTLPMRITTAGGSFFSPNTINIIGQQGGNAPPEIFLGDEATANGFSKSATVSDSTVPKALIHILKPEPNTDTTYPPPNEDAKTLYSSSINGVRLNGNGFANCSVIHFDAAQDCSMADLDIISTGCYAGITGWPGRGCVARNIVITGGRSGIHQKAIGPGVSNNVVGLGGQFMNLKISGTTVYGIKHTAARGSLSILGLDLSIASGVGIYAIGTDQEYGHTVLWDSIIRANGGIAIQASRTVVGLFNCYFLNATKIVDQTETDGYGDYNGNSTGWFYVRRFVNIPTRLNSSVGGVPIELKAIRDGVNLTDSYVASVNGPTIEGPDPQLVSQYYFREPDITDPTKVIWATASPSTPAPFTSSTAAVPYTNYTDVTSNSLPQLNAKLAEARAAGKALAFPGKSAGSGGTPQHIPVGGPVVLQDGDVIFGVSMKRCIFTPTTAWRTATQTGVQEWIVDTPDDANAEIFMFRICASSQLYTGQRIGCYRWRTGKGGIFDSQGSTQAVGTIRYPNHDLKVTGHGGGILCALRNGGTLVGGDFPEAGWQSEWNKTDQTDHRWISINDNVGALTVVGFDPEYGGGAERVPDHPALCLIDNATVRGIGCKSEAHDYVFEFRNGARVILGPFAVLNTTQDFVAAGYPQWVSGPIFKVDNSSQVELLAVSGKAGDLAGRQIFTEDADIITNRSTQVTADKCLGYYTRNALLNPTIFQLYTPVSNSVTDVMAFQSAIWTVYLEGSTPDTDSVAISDIDITETYGGSDISNQATVTVVTGSPTANINDAGTDTDFVATTKTAIKFQFSSPKSIKEIRIKPSATALNLPIGVVIEAYNSTTNDYRMMASRVYAATDLTTRIIQFNTRRVTLLSRARTVRGNL